jgi:hypothetical protein
VLARQWRWSLEGAGLRAALGGEGQGPVFESRASGGCHRAHFSIIDVAPGPCFLLPIWASKVVKPIEVGPTHGGSTSTHTAPRAPQPARPPAGRTKLVNSQPASQLKTNPLVQPASQLKTTPLVQPASQPASQLKTTC